MVTGELKSKIDSLWEIFWTGGITNPLDVVEQMTYLMFIHDLDDSDNIRAKEAAMLGLPYESIFCQRCADRGPYHRRQSAQMERVPRLSRRQDVQHRAGMGLPVHQGAPRR